MRIGAKLIQALPVNLSHARGVQAQKFSGPTVIHFLKCTELDDLPLPAIEPGCDCAQQFLGRIDFQKRFQRLAPRNGSRRQRRIASSIAPVIRRRAYALNVLGYLGLNPCNAACKPRKPSCSRSAAAKPPDQRAQRRAVALIIGIQNSMSRLRKFCASAAFVAANAICH